MKEYKGTDEVKTWRNYLPQKRVWVPGILRGREVEGLKFLLLSTRDDKMGKHHEKLIKALTDKFTYCMLDPENGYDIVLTYEAYDEAKSRLFGGAKFGFKELEVARGTTPISDDPEKTWAEIESSMKNVDKDVPRYEVKTSEDAIEALEKWIEAEDKKAKKAAYNKPVDSKKDNDGSEVVGEDEKPVKAEVKKEEVKKEETPAASDASARKAKALAMLKKS
jgi:hypothetical protein